MMKQTTVLSSAFLCGFLAVFTITLLNLLSAQNPSDLDGYGKRPNVVMFMADDLGYSDIEPYGSEIDTPHLDRLAENGMRFTSMHNTSKCFPSRASFLTGVYAPQAEMNSSPGTFADRVVSFGHVLKDAGYRTLFIGKHHSTTNPYNWGFDHYWGLRGGAVSYYNTGFKRSFDPGPPAQKTRNSIFMFDEKKSVRLPHPKATTPRTPGPTGRSIFFRNTRTRANRSACIWPTRRPMIRFRRRRKRSKNTRASTTKTFPPSARPGTNARSNRVCWTLSDFPFPTPPTATGRISANRKNRTRPDAWKCTRQ